MSQDNATPSPLDALLQQADACYAQDDHVGAIAPLEKALHPVSYTHLTLPTIYSV